MKYITHTNNIYIQHVINGGEKASI